MAIIAAIPGYISHELQRCLERQNEYVLLVRWESIEALVGHLEPVVVDELLAGVDRLVEVLARWYLQHAPGQLGRAIDAHQEPFHRFAEAAAVVVPDGWRQDLERAVWRLIDRGVPEELARRHVTQPLLIHGPNVVSLAMATGRAVEEVTRAFFLVGEVTHIDWLGARLLEIHPTTRWHRWALQAVEDDLMLLRRQIAERVLSQARGGDVDQAVAAYLASRQDVTARIGRFMRGLALEEASDLAALTVAVRQVRALAG